MPIHRRHYEHVQKLLFSQRLEMERAQLQLADWRGVSFVCLSIKLESKKLSLKSQAMDRSVYFEPNQGFT